MPIPGDVDVRSGFGAASADSDENAAQARGTAIDPTKESSFYECEHEGQVRPANIDRHPRSSSESIEWACSENGA
jgi:hypothetical protein